MFRSRGHISVDTYHHTPIGRFVCTLFPCRANRRGKFVRGDVLSYHPGDEIQQQHILIPSVYPKREYGPKKKRVIQWAYVRISFSIPKFGITSISFIYDATNRLARRIIIQARYVRAFCDSIFAQGKSSLEGRGSSSREHPSTT